MLIIAFILLISISEQLVLINSKIYYLPELTATLTSNEQDILS